MGKERKIGGKKIKERKGPAINNGISVLLHICVFVFKAMKSQSFFAATGQLSIIFQWHSALALQEALSTKSSTSGAVTKSLGLARSVTQLVQLLIVFGCPTPTNGGEV